MKFNVHIDGAFCTKTQKSAASVIIVNRETDEVVFFAAGSASYSGYDPENSVQAEIASAIIAISEVEVGSLVYLHTDCVAVCQSFLNVECFKSTQQRGMAEFLKALSLKRRLLVMPVLTAEVESVYQGQCHQAANEHLNKMRKKYEKRQRRKRETAH